MAKKALNRAKELLTNKWVLLAIFAVSIMLLIGFAIHRNIFGIVIFALVGFLTSFFSRNMTVILLISIAVTGLIIGIYPGSEMNEGFESKDDDEDTDDEEEKEKEDRKTKIKLNLLEKKKIDKSSDKLSEISLKGKGPSTKQKSPSMKQKTTSKKESSIKDDESSSSKKKNSDTSFLDKLNDYKERKLNDSTSIDIYKKSMEKLENLNSYMSLKSKEKGKDTDADD